ncbi:MAG: PAS domain S-box-containing protein, partial [Glaciecola sp.]
MKTKPDFFESLFNTVGGGVAVANIEGLIQFVNPGICKMLGYSQEEFQGIHVSEITAPDDIESTVQAIKEAVKNPGYEVQLEKVYLKKDGNRFYGLTTIKSYEHDGKLFLSAFINDFAEHYLARQRTEKQYKDIIELADDIIFTVDPSGNFVYANQMTQDITGASEKEILTRNYMDLVTPSHKKEVYKIYHEHFLSRNDSIQFTFPIQDADGGVCWLDQKLNTIWDT